jgi:hypothetical protein
VIIVGATDEPDEENRHAAGCSRLDAVMQPPELHQAKLRQGPLPDTLHAALPRTTAGQPDPRTRRPNEAPKPCAVPGCQAPSRTANIGPCSMHYERQRAGRPLDAPRRRARGAPPLPCEVAGCDRPARKLKLCGMHYQRLRNSGKAGSAESRIDEAIIAQNRMLAGSGQRRAAAASRCCRPPASIETPEAETA